MSAVTRKKRARRQTRRTNRIEAERKTAALLAVADMLLNGPLPAKDEILLLVEDGAHVEHRTVRAALHDATRGDVVLLLSRRERLCWPSGDALPIAGLEPRP